MASKHLRLRQLICALLLGITILVQARAYARQPTRIVAVGDIHGAFDAFQTILRSAGLMDAAGKWSGGNAILVQTGDYTDRGAGVRPVMDLLMTLEGEARAAGGRVEVLLGNHEVMNLIGDLRDVSPSIFVTFADAKSEDRRARAFGQFARLAARRAKAGRAPIEADRRSRDQWMAAHPPGWLEYWEAMAPRGRYGSWLRRKPIYAVVSGTLFMHAGLNPAATPATSAKEASDQVQAEIERLDKFRQRLTDAGVGLPFFTFDELLQVAAAEVRAATEAVAAAEARGVTPDLRGFDAALLREASTILGVAKWAIVAPEGPLWYRGYARDADSALEPVVAPMLQRNGLRRIVVGHTPQPDSRLTVRLGGRIVLIDTGMLQEVYKGRPVALEIQGDSLTAISVDDRQALLPPPNR